MFPYVCHVIFSKTLKSVNYAVVKLSGIGEISNLTSKGLMMNENVWYKIFSKIRHRKYNFESLKEYFFVKLFRCPKSTRRLGRQAGWGDFGQGSTENMNVTIC